MMNLLLGAVCFLIPIVGPLVYIGWLITGFWGREDERPETFPDFDFNQFAKYLERGVWPFLVSLVVSFAMVIPMVVLWFGFILGMVGLDAHQQGTHAGQDGPGLAFGIGMVVMVFVIAVVILVGNLIMVPLMLRAARTQDFREAFSFAWTKDFIARMWLDILLSMIVLMFGSFVLIIIGYMMICVGAMLVMPLIQYAWFHLKAQLYKAYIARGGQPVELSAKLRSVGPPPLAPPVG